MNTFLLLAALAAPIHAQPELASSYRTLSAAVRAARPAAVVAAVPIPFPAPRRRAPQLPETCARLPVVEVRDGDIYKDEILLGRGVRSYEANCDGLVVWQDSYGELHRDASDLFGDVAWYDVSWHGATVAWKDPSGDLFRDGEKLGRAQRHDFLKYTGDLVWQDSWGDLFVNRVKLGRAREYAAAQRTGDVAWIDSFGALYRNQRELGQARRWEISDRTGDVAWLDSYRNLHKNGERVAAGVDDFALREDGRLIWVDSSGRQHSI